MNYKDHSSLVTLLNFINRSDISHFTSEGPLFHIRKNSTITKWSRCIPLQVHSYDRNEWLSHQGDAYLLMVTVITDHAKHQVLKHIVSGKMQSSC
uniref:Uncharacterized protein n=1 Tax=Arundo donax TaxID=35708 RepID=A0A0A9H107_ARUDO